jgi:protein gp37
VPDEWIDRCFAVMALASQHRYQILTKRPARMREYILRKRAAAPEWVSLPEIHGSILLPYEGGWPANVWLGVSTEDQATAEERIPILLDTPASRRFISAEPMVGPIDLTTLDLDGDAEIDALTARSPLDHWNEEWAPEITGTTIDDAIEGFEDWGFTYPPSDKKGPRLDWVIVGGESGRGARPMHPGWARSLRDQCQAAGVPFFFKQWGEWGPIPEWTGHRGGGHFRKETAIGRDGEAIDADVNPDEVGGQRFALLGKKSAGRLLDGREWNEYPEQGARSAATGKELT